MRWLARLTEGRAALLATLLVLLAYLPASQTSLVRGLEGDLLDLRMRMKPERPLSDAIALVLIDDASIRELGRWPWSRGVLADLVAAVWSEGARTVGIDLLFAEPDTSAMPAGWGEALSEALRRHGSGDLALDAGELAHILGPLLKATPGDAELAAVLDQKGDVIVPFSFEFDAQAPGLPPPPYVAATAYRIVRSGTGGIAGLPAASGLLPPVAVIGEAAATLGHTNLALGADGAARFEQPAIAYRGEAYPSFAIEIARSYLGVPRDRTSLVVGRGVQLGERFVPTDAATRLVVGYTRTARFVRISAASLLNGEAAPALLRDKVVLIGGAAAGVGGRFPSPFGTEIAGVERQAAVIESILTGSFITRDGYAPLLGMGYLLIGGLIIGGSARRFGVLGASLALAVLLACLLALAFVAFFRFGLWLDLFLPLVGIFAIWAAAVGSAYLSNLRQERALRNAFQHYLNPALVDQVAKDPSLLRLGGEEKELTVLFADLRNSTQIAARMPAADLVQLLNDYFAAMTRIVFAQDALLDKYTGDGIVVIFGAPLPRPDHALSACESAIAMQDALRPLQERWARPGLPPLEMGIGINTGPMIIGNMGSAERFTYTVIGDDANLGSRLEAANKDLRTRILISQATFEKVGEDRGA
jgi:adenylate cyclase